MMNHVSLEGRLTRDPEVRYTAGRDQMAIAKFSIAIDRPTRKGEEKQTDYPRITVFGKQAEICERFLAKGRLVGIEGRIQTGSYKDKDGRTVYTTDVIASNVHFLEFGERPPVQRREEYPDPQPRQESRRDHEQQYTFDDIEEPEDFAAIDEDIPF